MHVYQGEYKECKYNFELDSFEVMILQTDKKVGEVQFNVTFKLDVESILNVSCVELGVNGEVFKNKNPIIAKTDKFSEENIETMIENRKLLDEADSLNKKTIQARVGLLTKCFEEKGKGNKNAEKIIQWNKKNKNASLEEFLEKENELYENE